MTKNEYIASQLALGKTHSQIIAEQPTELVQGSLLKKHYQEIKTILASGLRLHLDEYVPSTEHGKLAICALRETFDPQYLADEDFKVNFNVPKVAQLFQLCVDVGALPQSFADDLRDLAKYEKPLYDITQTDFVGEWHEIAPTDGQTFTLTLNARTPELTHIVVQMQDYSGEWCHATELHGIQSARPYRADLPYFGQARAIRWSCAYVLSGSVTVV